MTYRLYTDGSASPHGDAFFGGWAYCLVQGRTKLLMRSGGDSDTTISRMELTAVIEALEDGTVGELTLEGHRVQVFSDSRYVVDGATEWVKQWVTRGWRTSKNKPVKNADLWRRLVAQSSDLVTFHWVEGHSGDPLNDWVDREAKRTRLRLEDFI